MPSTFDLSGRVFILTGASSGIGQSTCELLLRSQAKIFAVDLSPLPASLVESSSKSPGSFCFHQVDLTAASAASDAVSACVAKFGPKIDGLLNVAGIMDDFTSADSISVEMYDKVIAVNLTAPIRLMGEVLKVMVKEGGGAIVNVSSKAGSTGAAAGLAYTASKHGLEGATKQTAWHFRDKGVRCNAVAPGGVKTNIMTDFSKLNMEGLMAVRPYTELNTSEQRPPMDPIETANSIVFLASDLATHISGAVLPVDKAWCAA